MNKEQIDKRIEIVCKEFTGQMPILYQMVGMIIVGRLFGWRVIRLTASRSLWKKTTQAFGDPKLLMPERGVLAHKSVGLKISDQLGEYWDFINGNKPRDEIPLHDRKMIV